MLISNSTFMKKRMFFLLSVITTHIFSYAQDNIPAIMGKDYVYALFSVENTQNYPILFAAILDSKDTLCIDTHSIDSCIKQIFYNAKSAPVMVQEYYETFYDVYGRNSIVHRLCERFSSEFEDLFGKCCLSKRFKLETGETVTIQYARFIGLTATTSYMHSLSVGLNTTDYPFLKERIIPLSILDCIKAEGFVMTCLKHEKQSQGQSNHRNWFLK